MGVAMPAGFRITVRNEHGEVVEYHCAKSILEIDVPEGRYVITVSSEAIAPGEEHALACGTLQ
jgi:hypothetical protein